MEHIEGISSVSRLADQLSQCVDLLFNAAHPVRLTIMKPDLSPKNQQYLAHVVACGLYPSHEGALNAAIAALPEKAEQIPFVPSEHLAAVERGIVEAEAGLSSPITEEDWSRLRERAQDVAAGLRPSGAL